MEGVLRDVRRDGGSVLRVGPLLLRGSLSLELLDLVLVHLALELMLLRLALEEVGGKVSRLGLGALPQNFHPQTLGSHPRPPVDLLLTHTGLAPRHGSQTR